MFESIRHQSVFEMMKLVVGRRVGAAPLGQDRSISFNFMRKSFTFHCCYDDRRRAIKEIADMLL